MTSTEAVDFANFFADLSQRSSNPAFDLSTVRDIVETMHVATKEPEDVSYAQVDAGGVEALWCIPAGDTADRGTFVYYDHRALLSVLLLEATRAGAVVVRQHLGPAHQRGDEVTFAVGILVGGFFVARDFFGILQLIKGTSEGAQRGRGCAAKPRPSQDPRRG